MLYINSLNGNVPECAHFVFLVLSYFSILVCERTLSVNRFFEFVNFLDVRGWFRSKSLVNKTIPLWWNDLDNILVLELTVLYNNTVNFRVLK